MNNTLAGQLMIILGCLVAILFLLAYSAQRSKRLDGAQFGWSAAVFAALAANGLAIVLYERYVGG